MCFGQLETEILPWGIAIGISLVGALTDLASRRIPNALTFPFLAGGLACALARGGAGALGEAALACIVVSLPFVLLFVFAGGGAGDAKLMGAVGAWLGLGSGIVALGSVCAAGVAFAVVHALSRNRLRAALSNMAGLARAAWLFVASRGRFREAWALAPRAEEMQAFPYGIAIFLGVALAAVGVYTWCP
jgi:Flp pilus assembly protein protease CpaA